FLRAYFAFKMGLPFGYSKCSRGGGGHAPKCFAWWNIHNLEPANQPDPQAAEQPQAPGLLPASAQKPPAAPPTNWVVQSPDAAKRLGLATAFGRYVTGPVADGVHSGSGRTALVDDNTDYYPIPLKEETLRPGTVYADPYGHMLMIVHRIAQTETQA